MHFSQTTLKLVIAVLKAHSSIWPYEVLLDALEFQEQIISSMTIQEAQTGSIQGNGLVASPAGTNNSPP